MVWYQLTRWCAYPTIKHPQMPVFAFYIPFAMAAFGAVLTLALPTRVQLTGPTGLLPLLAQVLSTLPGFYLAALAAVATFKRPEMDELMPEPTPTVSMKFGKEYDKVKLTRRIFLSYLFSYLAVLSLLATFACLFANFLWPSLVPIFTVGDPWYSYISIIPWVRAFFFLALYLALSSILVTTLQGIYFLTERMHQPAA